jgi:tetratricopeptide (TPR) repeat protein
MKKLPWLFMITLIITACQSELKTVSEYEEAGKKAFFKEDYETARKYLGRAVEMESSNRDILYFLGISYQREYMLDSALFYLKRADLLYPNDREVNVAIYPIAAELQEWEYAIRAIGALIQTGDPIEKYRERLADLNTKEGNLAGAYIHATYLLEAEPDNPERYFQLASLANEIDSFNIAIELMDEAIDKFEENDQFYLTKAIAHGRRGESKIAERILRPLAEADNSPAQYKYNLAWALSNQDSRQKKLEAYELFQQVVKEIPPDNVMDSIMTVLKDELYPDSL